MSLRLRGDGRNHFLLVGCATMRRDCVDVIDKCLCMPFLTIARELCFVVLMICHTMDIMYRYCMVSQCCPIWIWMLGMSCFSYGHRSAQKSGSQEVVCLHGP